MSGIRGKDTQPEMIIRRHLHARGFRFRLHNKMLPGRPDLVLRKHRAVIFVNGCFWHGHKCSLFKWPKSREQFWRDKIGSNIARDQKNYAILDQMGWRKGLIWECAIKGRGRQPVPEIIDRISDWLQSGTGDFSIAGEITIRSGEAGK